MWLEDISQIMYEKCKIDDKEEYWSMITNNKVIYLYCLKVKDRSELWKKLVDSK